MTLSEDTRAELHRLIHLQLTGEISEPEHDALAAMLEQSEAAQQEFVEAMHDIGVMRQVLCVDDYQAAKDSGNPAEPSTSPTTPKSSTVLGFLHAGWSTFSQPTTFSLSIAASLIALVVVVMALMVIPGQLIDTAAPPEESHVVAKVTDLREAVWAKGQPALVAGTDLLNGESISLTKGRIEIQFADGATVTLEGPADFVVQTEASGLLTKGKALAHASGEAKGFQVRTPAALVTDLGTEFGIEIFESGEEQFHVFQGKVECAWSGSSGEPKSVILHEGESMTLLPNQPTPEKHPADEEQFAIGSGRPADNLAVAWGFTDGKVRADSGVAGELLVDATADGALKLPSANASAILPDTDKVNPASGYTVCLWLKLDEARLQHILVRTNQEGATTHFSHQLFQDEAGRLVHYTFAQGPSGGGETMDVAAEIPTEAGRWVHVAISGEAGGRVKLYVDGNLLAVGGHDLPGFWRDGDRFVVGGSARRASGEPIPGMIGEVDRVLIYNFALPQNEIRMLAAAGNSPDQIPLQSPAPSALESQP